MSQSLKVNSLTFGMRPQLYNHQPHGGEGLKEFKHRVEDSIKRMIAENAEGNILIVTHAVVIRAMLSFVMEKCGNHHLFMVQVYPSSIGMGKTFTLNS